MKRSLIVLSVAIFVLLPTLVTAASTKKSAPSPYGGIFEGKEGLVTAASSFITLRKAGNKVWFEIPTRYLGRPMLMASTLSDISSGQWGTIGLKEQTPLYIRFSVRDSTLYIRQINSAATTDYASKALARVNLDPVLWSFRIEAWGPDKTSVVADLGEIFADNPAHFNLFSPESATPAPTIDKEASTVDVIKAFDDNLSVVSTLVFGLSDESQSSGAQPVTARVTRSILLLPEKPMTPRISDTRVGVFNTTKTLYSAADDDSRAYSVANRWRLVPSDIEAYARGEVVEPTKKIVFWVDDAFPESWKQPIKEAVENWNCAFETIGFRGVMEARPFPTAAEDPAFDPDNLKYSCIRFLPSTTVNAMGPAWIDPATGEVICASVIVWSDVVKMLNRWRFIQTAQLDPSVRARKMPADVMADGLRYVIAHEVGHTLGFAHNMASSAAWSVDSLRSPSFTQKYGTTPSIMDYARFNYVAQPSDAGVRLTPPEIGVYDYFLVKWTYKYVPDARDEWDEAPTVESWVDEVAADPIYRYGRQQVGQRYDPSSIEEDLGDDPLRAGDYGVANLRYILPNLATWIEDDSDYQHRAALYKEMGEQYFRYLRAVVLNIGGIYLRQVKVGTPGERIEPVPRERQKASLDWVMNQYRSMDWIDEPSVVRNLDLGSFMAASLRERVATDLRDRISNVVLSSYYAASYSPAERYGIEEFMDDLYAATWRNVIARRPPTKGDLLLQKAMVEMMCGPLDKIDSTGGDDSSIVGHQGPAQAGSRNFGPAGMGLQGEVDITAIDNSEGHLIALAVRSRALLRKAARRGDKESRAHYLALVARLNSALRDKILGAARTTPR